MKREEIIYSISKRIYEGKITKKDGILRLTQETDLSESYSNIIVTSIYPKLFEGEVIKRTTSNVIFRNFLEFIKRDYGNENLFKALNSLKQHIDYIKIANKDSKVTLRKIYAEYLELYKKDISEFERNEIEQNEIIESFKEKSRREIKIELDNLPKFETEEIIINQKKYKRDNKAIALIKILRKNECQICGEFIRKKDGTKYIEACHIKAKREKGNESLENIILLCPNHHKEFDLGDLKINEHSNEIIKFTMNEKDYEIELKINI
ncbi:MAG: HNH endonuclease [Polaribacter sp.]|uniref:HNH endonuclease n=1 Tax=Polaribacter sp. TaxID=1920175 RepID=UPI002F354CDD